MIAAFLLLQAAPAWADCVPARWPSADAASLERLNNSPINCLIVPEGAPALAEAARARRLRVVTGAEAGLQTRAAMKLDGSAPVAATREGVWPGIRALKDGAAQAGPTASAWIETNSGFLRFARAVMAPGTALWIGNTPPPDLVLDGRAYVRAIGDAAISGARWVVSPDEQFTGWEAIVRTLRFYEENRRWWDCPDLSRLAVVQEAGAGALATGGILDMIVTKHIPVQPVTPQQLLTRQWTDVKMLLNLDPSLLNEDQKLKTRELARRGASLVNGPPGWKLDAPGAGWQFSEAQVKQIGDMWREINGILGRRNFGVRLFNASTVLSSLKSPDGGKTAAVHLVNYADYPVEELTVQVSGPYKTARLLTPRGAVAVETFPWEEGIEITVKKLEDVGIVVLQ